MLEPSPKQGGDYGGFSILAGNAVTIILALSQNWDLGPLMLIYWAQSVTIGVFHVFRMLKLRQFSTEGFTSGEDPIPETTEGKRYTVHFFAAHFGFFHLIYAVFVFSLVASGEGEKASTGATPGMTGIDWLWILIGIIAFVISHGFSFMKNVDDDIKSRPNLGTMMMMPYLRIVPMHLTILFGGGIGTGNGWIPLLIFLLLKTLADYLFHIIEHRVLRKNRLAEN